MTETEEQKHKKNLDGILTCVFAFIGVFCIITFFILDRDTDCCDGF